MFVLRQCLEEIGYYESRKKDLEKEDLAGWMKGNKAVHTQEIKEINKRLAKLHHFCSEIQ
jgi:hypothetical protein